MKYGGISPLILDLRTRRIVKLMSRPLCSQKVWPMSQNIQYKTQYKTEVMFE
jgi:hypothetical protein